MCKERLFGLQFECKDKDVSFTGIIQKAILRNEDGLDNINLYLDLFFF